MRRKRRTCEVLILLAFLGILVLVSLRMPNENILTFGMYVGSTWGTSNSQSYKIAEEAVKEFEKEHPEIEVRLEIGVQKEDYLEWLTEQYLLGKEPDVFLMTTGEFNFLASRNGLLNLEGLMHDDKKFNVDAYYEAPLSFAQYEKVQYALPFENVLTVMCVNTKLLKDAGIALPDNNWDWGDFHSICRRMTKDLDGDGELDRFGVYNYSWRDAACSNGTALFDETGTVNYLNNWNVMNAVNYVYKLEGLNGGYPVTLKDAQDGRVAFYPMLYSEYRAYQNYPWKAERADGVEWTCMTMPAGPKGDNVSEIQSSLMGISARTANKEMAWELLKKLTYDKAVQSRVTAEAEGVSAIRGVLTDPMMAEAMDKAAVTPKFKNYTLVMDMMNEGVEEAMSNDNNMTVSLLSLHKKINNYLKNR